MKFKNHRHSYQNIHNVFCVTVTTECLEFRLWIVNLDLSLPNLMFLSYGLYLYGRMVYICIYY